LMEHIILNPKWKPEDHPGWEFEEHPEKWYVEDIPNMKCLILGSFPPYEDKRDYPFYYPNTSNRFWKILADIAEIKLQYTKKSELKTPEAKEKAVKERIEIMKTLNVGVQNMGKTIYRKEKSPLDTDIRIIKTHDIFSIIEKYNIKKILLPGYSAADSTTKSFLRYLDYERISYNVKEIKANRFFFIKDDIKCFILYSTSNSNGANVTYDELLRQFKTALTQP